MALKAHVSEFPPLAVPTPLQAKLSQAHTLPRTPKLSNILLHGEWRGDSVQS